MKPSICCVDDHERCREAVIGFLLELGYEAVSFPSAEAFFSDKRDYVQIIVDQHLDGITGIELVKRLRREGDTTPIILYSGYLTEETIAEAERLQNVSLLEKPFRLSEFMQLLHR